MTFSYVYLFNKYIAEVRCTLSAHKDKTSMLMAWSSLNVHTCCHREVSSLKRKAPKRKSKEHSKYIKVFFIDTIQRYRKEKNSKQAPNYTVMWIMLPPVWSSCNVGKGFIMDVERCLIRQTSVRTESAATNLNRKEGKGTPIMPNPFFIYKLLV